MLNLADVIDTAQCFNHSVRVLHHSRILNEDQFVLNRF